MDFLEKSFYISKCQAIHNLVSFEEVFIKPAINNDLDVLVEKYNKNERDFHEIHETLNRLMHAQGNIPGASSVEYVKIHQTEKSGRSFQITKKRGTFLKDIIKQQHGSMIIENNSETLWKDVKFKNATTTNDEIDIPFVNRINREMVYQRDQINKVICATYFELLGSLETQYYSFLENIASYLSKVDVLITKAYIAKTYNYCCPEIDEKHEKSFVDAKALRHVLIEHLQTNELYVPNDICLGKNGTNGILLYGTNAVGKTSLIRALGISIVMAQAGMYVPCSKFVYKPYSSIFSRILGNDNLFKGLSTFAVEMSELRVILKMANEESLILGDELCSGTETESALSIFVSGLMQLYEKKSSHISPAFLSSIMKKSRIYVNFP